ncbi:MAG: hypothetical protein AAFW84_33940 [Cyanobacteria bacterium J06635_15]
MPHSPKHSSFIREITAMKKNILAVAITSLAVTGCTLGGSESSAELPIVEEPESFTEAPIVEAPQESDTQTATFADGSVEMQFPVGWHENDSEHPYDLQYFSEFENMNTGLFLYKSEDLAAESTPQAIFEWHVEDLGAKRENFTVQETEQTENIGDNTITTVVYSGDKDASRFYYKFTLVEFAEDPDRFLVALQVAIPSEWSASKPILEEIMRSARISSASL